MRKDWKIGPFAHSFPAKFGEFKEMELPDIEFWSKKKSPFGSAGYAWIKRDEKNGGYKRMFRSWKAIPIKEEPGTISDIMVQRGEEGYDESYEVSESDLHKWEYEKGAKREFRIRKADLEKHPELVEIYEKCKKSKSQAVWDEHKSDFEAALGTDGSYNYDEGAIAFPDPTDRPSRTVVTSEIGRSASRMRHIIRHEDGTYRTLFPIETERLNMFPDDWTRIEGIPDSKRGFMMGNALVVGIVQRLSEPLRELLLGRGV